MARIGRQIPHFREVDPASIRATFSGDRKYRYLLEMEYGGTLYSGGRSRRVAVILKNPSAADQNAADSTIRKVETFIFHRMEDVLHLSILNLFAFRATDAKEVNEEFKIRGEAGVVGPDNDRMIRDAAQRADIVVAAWGGPSGIDKELYEKRIQVIGQLLQSVCPNRVFEVRGERVTRQPLHGMMWAYSHSLEPYVKLKEPYQ